MSLDIHIGNSSDEAEQLHPELPFEEDVHDFLFSPSNEWIKKYPLFGRMQDYYQDAVYQNVEIESLKEEVEEICHITNDINHKAFLQKFIDACDTALLENKNIYCFCD